MKIIYTLCDLPDCPLKMIEVKDEAEAKEISSKYAETYLYKGRLLFCVEVKK